MQPDLVKASIKLTKNKCYPQIDPTLDLQQLKKKPRDRQPKNDGVSCALLGY